MTGLTSKKARKTVRFTRRSERLKTKQIYNKPKIKSALKKIVRKANETFFCPPEPKYRNVVSPPREIYIGDDDEEEFRNLAAQQTEKENEPKESVELTKIYDNTLPCERGCPPFVRFVQSITRNQHYHALHPFAVMTPALDEAHCWLKWCTACGQAFEDFIAVDNHICKVTQVISAEKYYCEYCHVDVASVDKLQRSFQLREDRDRHCRRDHNMTTREIQLGERTCYICGRVEQNKYALSEHFIVHNPLKKALECELGCLHTYYRYRSQLHEHYRREHGEKYELVIMSSYKSAHKCPICLKIFITPKALDAHVKIHAFAGRSYKCTLGCRQSSFCTEAGLHLHYSRFHSQQQTYVKQSHQQALMILHKCQVCDEQLGGAEALKLHMRIHNPLLAFECSKCLRVFFETQNELDTHWQLKHSPHLSDLGFKYEQTITMMKHENAGDPMQDVDIID